MIIFIIDTEIKNVNIRSHRNSKTLKRLHATLSLVQNGALYNAKKNSTELSESC